MNIVRRIYENEMVPAWYGVAWRDWQCNRVVCLPLGMNLLAGLARSAYFTAKHSWRPVMDNPRAAYQQGYNAAIALTQEPRK